MTDMQKHLNHFNGSLRAMCPFCSQTHEAMKLHSRIVCKECREPLNIIVYCHICENIIDYDNEGRRMVTTCSKCPAAQAQEQETSP